MNEILTELGICKDAQLFFDKNYSIRYDGKIIFSYGNVDECFDLNYHSIPKTVGIWIAGSVNINSMREIFIVSSAIEAISFLSLNRKLFKTFDNIGFISMGTCPSHNQFLFIRAAFPGRKFALIMGKDLISRVFDIKVAIGIKQKEVDISLLPDDSVKVIYKGGQYNFDANKLTLNAFEKNTGFRSGMKTYKPKYFNSYYESLRFQLDSLL